MRLKNLDEPNKSTEPDWWIEIRTDNPSCLYYFGAFDSFATAVSVKDDYISDLLAEKATILSVEIKQCQPQQLTTVLENKTLQIISIPNALDSAALRTETTGDR